MSYTQNKDTCQKQHSAGTFFLNRGGRISLMKNIEQKIKVASQRGKGKCANLHANRIKYFA